MKKYLITFDQVHVHSHNGNTLDKDTIGIIKGKDYAECRKLAFKLFGDKFAFMYTYNELNTVKKYYPENCPIIELN